MTPAPDLTIEKWLNTETELQLESFRGKVVCVFVFQLLCPGCVQHLVPQAKKVHAYFSPHDLVVLGLHSVFEHHAAMREGTLRAFLHEYGISFPVGIDAHSPNDPEGIPQTMRTYGMKGTPTTLLIDRKGILRSSAFGHVDDLALGAEIMRLIQGDSAGNDRA